MAAPSTNRAADIRSLYRAFRRVHSAWPPEPDRPGRNLRDALGERLQVAFRNKATSEADLTAKLLYGEQQLRALQRLLVNEFRLKYPRNPDIAAFTEPFARRRQLLDTDAQSYLANLKPSFWNKLTMLFTSARQGK